MSKLAQLIAVQSGVKSRTYRDQTDLLRVLEKPIPLSGISRTYTPKDDLGEQLPAEATKVQASAEQVLADTAKLLTRYFDLTASVDATNCTAQADVLIGGKALFKDLPVPTLLFLEKQLQVLLTTMRRLPKLDPAETWTFDEASNAWRTEPTETLRTRKLPRNHVMAEATDKHPAQVTMYTEDVPVGTWKTVKFSGAMPASRVAALTGRAEELLTAVKMARETANSATAIDRKIGETLFAYLLA